MTTSPAFVAFGALASRSSSGDIVPAEPTGLRGRDLVFLTVGVRNTDLTYSVDAGWTELDVATSSTVLGMRVYYRLWTGAEGATERTVSTTGGTTSAGIYAYLSAWRGVDPADVVDTASVDSSGTDATTFTPTGLSTTADNATAIQFVAVADDVSVLTLNTAESFTLRASTGLASGTGSDVAFGAADRNVATAGAVTSPTWTRTDGVTDAWVAVTVSVTPGPENARLYAEEVLVLTTGVPGNARLYAEEVLVLREYINPDASISATTVQAAASFSQPPAATFVQTTENGRYDGAASNGTFGANTQAGSVVLLAFYGWCYGPDTMAAPTVTGAGKTWTLVGSGASANGRNATYLVRGTGAGGSDTVTVTPDAATDQYGWVAVEVTGISADAPADTGGSYAADSASISNFTATNDGLVAWAVGSDGGVDTIFSSSPAAGSWTQREKWATTPVALWTTPAAAASGYNLSLDTATSANQQYAYGAFAYLPTTTQVTTDSTVSPATVAATAAVGAAGLAGTPEPVTVQAVAEVGAAQVVAPDATATPATVEAVTAVEAATVEAGQTATPATVEATATVGTADVVSPAAPATVEAAATVGAPTVEAGQTVSPATVQATGAVGVPTVQAQADATVTPTTVDATATVPTARPVGLRVVSTLSGTQASSLSIYPTADSGYASTLTGAAEGDLVIVNTVHKFVGAYDPDLYVIVDNIALDGGWTEVPNSRRYGSTGVTPGVDVGRTIAQSWYRTVTAADLGAANFEWLMQASTGTGWVDGSGCWSVVVVRGNRTRFSLTGTSGEDATGGATFTATADGTLAFQPDDMVLVNAAIPTDVSTPSQFSAHSLTASGVSFTAFTEITEYDNAIGDDSGGFVGYAIVAPSSASATAAPTHTATAGGTTTNVYGPISFVRIRSEDIQPATVQATGIVPDREPAASLIDTFETVLATVTFGAVNLVRDVASSTTMGGMTGTMSVEEARDSWSATITYPQDGQLVGDGGLTVTATMLAGDNRDAEVQVQIADVSNFATLLDDATSAEVRSGDLASVTLSGLVDGTTYYLRARAGHSAFDEWGSWSATVTVDALGAASGVSAGFVYLYANEVDASVPMPHIWHATLDGYTVTLYGAGFGNPQNQYTGTAWIDGDGLDGELTVTSWTRVAASGSEGGDDREITVTGSIDPQHDKIVGTIPNYFVGRVGIYIRTEAP